MRTLIYIHGFGSSGLAKKAQLLKQKYGGVVLTPSLPYTPEPAIDSLKNLIEYSQQFGEVGIIGASLGGYYALHLQHIFNLKAVVINPAVRPHIRLREAVPEAINYYDNSRFQWRSEYLNYLEKLPIGTTFNRVMQLLQRGDEVLDYREAENMLIGSKKIIEDGGNHSFTGFENHFKEIEHFLFG